jgi:ABC-type uncharacterized transport system permease subunit
MTQTTTFQPTIMQKLLGRNYKWWFLVLYNFRLSLAHSLSAFFIILRDFTPLLISLTIYSSFSKSREYIEYFVVGNFLYKLYTLFGDIAWEVRSDIFYGGLSNKLLYPSSYILSQIFACIGGNFYTVLINLVLLVLIMIGNGIVGHFSLVFLIWVVVGCMIYFMIDFLVGTMTFWIQSTNTMIEMKSAIVPFLAGGLVLLDTNNITKSFVALPFAFLVHHPMQIYLGKYDFNQTVLVFAGGIVWCVVLYFLAKWVFAMGLKRNEAVGL